VSVSDIGIIEHSVEYLVPAGGKRVIAGKKRAWEREAQSGEVPAYFAGNPMQAQQGDAGGSP
jgi:hypothetical protein